MNKTYVELAGKEGCGKVHILLKLRYSMDQKVSVDFL